MLWAFFILALPITLGAVVCTVVHYASPKVMQHVKVVVAYAWFVNVSIVILTPVDVSTVRLPSLRAAPESPPIIQRSMLQSLLLSACRSLTENVCFRRICKHKSA